MSNNLVCKPDNIIQEDWLKRLAVIVRENEKDFEWFRDAIDRQLLKERFNVSKLEKQQDLLFKENERNVREIGRLREDADGLKIVSGGRAEDSHNLWLNVFELNSKSLKAEKRININMIGVLANFFLILAIFCIIL